MGKKLSESIKQEVCQRFLAGETNITKLAEEFTMDRKTIRKILKTSCPDFGEVIRETRRQNAQKRRQQQIEAVYSHRGRPKVTREEANFICNLFWTNKCLWDEIGPYTEIEIAKLLKGVGGVIELTEIIRVLKREHRYRILQRTREQNQDLLMRRTHQQDTLSMSRSRKLNTVQSVMLNLSAYTLDDKKQCLVYSSTAKKPADLPQKLSLRVFLEFFHYVSNSSEEHNQKIQEADPARKIKDPQD